MDNMIDDKFCAHLEYAICAAFEKSGYEEIRGFWCDGVLPTKPDYQYSEKYINDKRMTVLKAFIGRDGQTEYELILKFGNKSLSRYARDLDFYTDGKFAYEINGFDIDIKNKILEIRLV